MNIFGSLKEKITQYIDVRLKLFKLSIIGGTANLLSYLILALISLFIVFAIILFLGFGLVEVFISAGCTKLAALFITTGVYLVFLSLVMLFRKQIVNFFAGAFIRVMTANDKDDDDDDEEEEEKK